MEEGAVVPGVAVVTEERDTVRSEVPDPGETGKKQPSPPGPPFALPVRLSPSSLLPVLPIG